MAPEIRALAGADASAFAALRLEGVVAHPAAFLLTEAEARALTPEQVARQLAGGRVLGAFQGGRLIGCAGFGRHPWSKIAHRADVGPVYVLQAQWGRGVASRLMAAIDARARAAGITQLELWVAQDNLRARAFYTDLGYRGIARMPAAVRTPDGAQDDILMLRDLSVPRPAPAGEGLQRLGRADWRLFRDIRLHALQVAPTAFGSTVADWSAKAPDEVADWLDRVRTFAVIAQGRALSVAGWHRYDGPVTPHRGHVVAAFTRIEAQGKGHFRRLMEAIEADARAQGIAQLELDVGADNAPARSAYGRLGFVATGGIPRAMIHDGRAQNLICMVRPL